MKPYFILFLFIFLSIITSCSQITKEEYIEFPEYEPEIMIGAVPDIPSTDFTEDMSSCWSFDDHVVDYGDGEYRGTKTGPEYTDGHIGRGMRFDPADNDLFKVADSGTDPYDNIAAITVNQWIYAYDSAIQNSRLIHMNGAWSLYMETQSEDELRMRIVADISVEVDTQGVSNTYGEWVMLTWRWEPGNYSFFKNGVLIFSEDGGNTGTIADVSVDLYFGIDEDESLYRFNGTMDETQIWQDAKSDAEILELYNGGTGYSCHEIILSNADHVNNNVAFYKYDQLIRAAGEWTEGTIGTGCTPVWDCDGTPSNNTGPCSYPNCPTDDAGFDDNCYWYTEMSSGVCVVGEAGTLTTINDINFSDYGYGQISFYVHRLGTNLENQTLEENTSGTWTELWTETSSDSADEWIRHTVDLSDLTGIGDLRLLLYGNAQWSNDMAYDSIEIKLFEDIEDKVTIKGEACNARITTDYYSANLSKGVLGKFAYTDISNQNYALSSTGSAIGQIYTNDWVLTYNTDQECDVEKINGTEIKIRIWNDDAEQNWTFYENYIKRESTALSTTYRDYSYLVHNTSSTGWNSSTNLGNVAGFTNIYDTEASFAVNWTMLPDEFYAQVWDETVETGFGYQTGGGTQTAFAIGRPSEMAAKEVMTSYIRILNRNTSQSGDNQILIPLAVFKSDPGFTEVEADETSAVCSYVILKKKWWG